MDRSVLYCLAKKANETEHNSHIKGEPFTTANFVRSSRHTKYSQVFYSVLGGLLAVAVAGDAVVAVVVI